MKKILCLIDTLGIRGGAERQMIGLVQLLRQRGYNTTVAVYHDNPALPYIKEHYGIEPLIIKVKSSQWSKLKAVRHHIKQEGGYDSVITYKGGPNSIGCLLKLMGMKFRLIVSERNTNQQISHYDKLQFTLYRKADFIVPNSQSQANFIESNFPNLKRKIRVITNFTDTTHFIPKPISRNGKIIVLTTARIAKQKNTLRYLDAIALLRDKGVDNIHFDWYGDVQHGEEAYGEEVKRKLSELQLEDIITFHPATTNIAEKYQQCDIFCLPSNFEGYPNVVCEAMSCGKPVVCSRVCDIPVIVRENENGLMFDPSDVNDIADKLLKMVKMPKGQQNEWGQKGREIAETQFSRDAFVDKYIRLIEE